MDVLEARRKHALERYKNNVKDRGMIRARNHAPPLSANRSRLVRSTLKKLKSEAKPEGDKSDPTVSKLIEIGIKPVYDPRPQEIKTTEGLDFSDMRAFLSSPLPKDVKLQCYVMRNKGGIGGKMYPIFELYMEGTNRFLLAGRKKGGSKTSYYTLASDKTKFGKGEFFLGKLRSNFLGTEFTIYSGQGKEKKKKVEDDDSSGQSELGAIIYESNFLGSKGPRQMTVALPTYRNGLWSEYSSPSSKEPAIVKAVMSKEMENLYTLVNKPPKWNAQVRAYVLDFNNRVTMPSVKNFQLIHSSEANTVILQFGRVGKDGFSLDFRHPLSPLQAFAIALSSCDYKLVCE